MMNATEIIKKLINLVGVTSGIIITAIGSIMLISSFLKLYVFGIEKGAHFDPKWSCNIYDIEEKITNDLLYSAKNVHILEIDSENKNIKKVFSEKEKEELAKKHKKCILDENQKEKEKYFLSKKENMADGLALLIVGFTILLIYKMKKKR
jgi:hypothetical protein